MRKENIAVRTARITLWIYPDNGIYVLCTGLLLQKFYWQSNVNIVMCGHERINSPLLSLFSPNL